MLTLSALLVSVFVVILLLVLGRSGTIVAKADSFNKVGTAIALCIAAVWVLIQDRDATRLNIEQKQEWVRQGDRINLFISVTAKNDGDTPILLRERSFAVWLDRTFPTGNERVEDVAGAYVPAAQGVVPVIRVRDAQTVAMLVSEGHEFYGHPAVDGLIDQSAMPGTMKRYFHDDRGAIDEELQPGADSVFIFWTPLSCAHPAVYVSRFEIEARRSWYRTAWLYLRNGFTSPGPLYSRNQALVDLYKACEPAPVATPRRQAGRGKAAG